MKGMTLHQYNEIVAFVQKHHRFGWVREENQLSKDDYGMNIKYIDSKVGNPNDVFAFTDWVSENYWVANISIEGIITYVCKKDQKNKFSVKELYEIYSKQIEQLNSIYDTRDACVWLVSFRGMGHNVRFATNSIIGAFASDKLVDAVPFDNLYDWVMAYLRREWKITKLTEEYVIVKDK